MDRNADPLSPLEAADAIRRVALGRARGAPRSGRGERGHRVVPRGRGRGFKTRGACCARVKVRATLHGFEPKERDLDLPEDAVADDAPRACGIRPELVIVFRDGRPVPGDAPLREGDAVRILRVVSGGALTAG